MKVLRNGMVFFLIVATVLAFSDVLTKFKEGWADRVLYMIMIDRFNDGDPSNNNQAGVEYNPLSSAKYSGGDLKGILDKLDYIEGLGVDGIWITPPVANQWWDPWVSYGGYHGYWARDFKKVDEHFGKLEDYVRLSQEIHKRGMFLIQDIVVNHVGNYFRFKNGRFELNKASIPTSAPTQYPFNLNNYNDPEQRKRAIYHWTPDIQDFSDPNQKLNYQMSGLDDLNTENPEVVQALKDSYIYWIKNVGVDGYRVDTAMYAPKEFFDEFLKGENGILSQKKNFIVFGEVWLSSPPYEDTADFEIASYFNHGFNAMLDFPLSEEIRRVIKGRMPTDYLAYRLSVRNEILNKGLLVTFIDNHDMERFSRGASEPIIEQALAFLLSIPGLPVIYYGTEQGFIETRASMFKDGWGSGGEDHFNEKSRLYTFIKKTISFRKAHPATRYGEVKVLLSDKRGAGLLVFSLKSSEEELLIVMNTSEEPQISNFETPYESGTVLKPVYRTSAGINYDLKIKDQGYLTIKVPSYGFTVFKVTNHRVSINKPNVYVKIDLENGEKIKNLRKVSGETNAKRIYVYLDRKKNRGEKIIPKDGKFSFTLNPYKLDPGTHVMLIRAVGKSLKDVRYTKEYEFTVEIEKKLLAKKWDRIGDDRGPSGKYMYPTDLSFKRQMDIVGVKVEQMGNTLIISIKPKDLTKTWSPPNGFDHVTYQIFIDDPGKQGIRVLPFQNYEFADWDWDYEVFVTGWSSAIFTSKGANKDKFGKQIGSPDIIVEDSWIKIIIKGEWLGYPESYSGWKIYITSWDYDGIENRFRPIYKKPKAFAIGGGEPTDPYIMDDVWIEIK